jgi:chaperone modulatory protein CbpM
MNVIRLDEACEICKVGKEVIFQFIEEEWINPIDKENLIMDEEDLARIRLIRDLRESFGVNDEGMSIILQLLDQLNRMHLELEKRHQGDFE